MAQAVGNHSIGRLPRRGRSKSAQVSPGQRPGGENHHGTLALKGRYKRMRARRVEDCFALSGQTGLGGIRAPGRCPGLICFAPSGHTLQVCFAPSGHTLQVCFATSGQSLQGR